MRLFSPRLIAYVTRNHTGERGDEQMGGIPMHRGLGPHVRGESDRIRGLGTIGAPQTFGHGGVGSSYSWADPTSGVSFTYLTNFVSPDPWHSARLDRVGESGARGDRLSRCEPRSFIAKVRRWRSRIARRRRRSLANWCCVSPIAASAAVICTPPRRAPSPWNPARCSATNSAAKWPNSGAAGWQRGDRVVALPLRECDECRPLGGCRDRLGILCSRTQVIGLAAAAPGGYAEYVRLPAHNALRVPDGVDLRSAALTEPLSVGAHAVRMAGNLLGARVLVIGGGPIGLATLLFARAAGARHVVVSELDATRRARATALGATAAIDPATDRPGAAFTRISGAAPDVVFECVGIPGMLRQCIDIAPLHGRVVVVGACRQEDAFVPRVALRKELTLQFVLGYTRDEFALVLDMLASGRIDAAPLITDVIGLDALPEVFERLRRPNPQAKVLIDPRI